MKTLKCAICKGLIGKFDLVNIKSPIQGSMFEGLKSDTRLFNPVVQWEHMYCPLCQKRPFITRDEMHTTGGIVTIQDAEDFRQKLANGIYYEEKAKNDLADKKLEEAIKKDDDADKKLEEVGVITPDAENSLEEKKPSEVDETANVPEAADTNKKPTESKTGATASVPEAKPAAKKAAAKKPAAKKAKSTGAK